MTVLRHALERFKNSNTGRLVAMALANAELVDVAVRGAPPLPFAPARDAWLLWPEGDVLAAPPPAPIHMIVLDGTWPQARRMLQRLPALRGLPRLALPPPRAPLERLRRTRTADQMSTLEAVAHALAFLEGDAAAAPLVALHRRFVAASVPAHARR